MTKYIVEIIHNGTIYDEVSVEAESKAEAEIIGLDQFVFCIGAEAREVPEIDEEENE